MPRRLLVPALHPGLISLPDDQAHHARNVLRLNPGEEVELFTATGQSARGAIVELSAQAVVIEIKQIQHPAAQFQLTIASAIPKGARADWMIEKLSELGVARFVPLITERSVVHPEGKNKIERWQRLAAESAKQSRRRGVMQIEPLTALAEFLKHPTSAAYLSTAPHSQLLPSILPPPSSTLSLLTGPEGGWSDTELTLFADRHLTPITLGGTILRIETAAIAAASVVAALMSVSSITSSEIRLENL
jgi:16S rRNA (uracil1498-N3)-methyltransferase